MRNIEVNKVYKLVRNSCYVYCLYALPLPVVYGMVQNQECIGILISSPEEAVKIYEILSNDKLSYNEVITTLKEKYVFVTFWSIEVTSAPKDPYYQLRKIQEANKKNLSDDETLIHYSQAKLKENVNTAPEDLSNLNTNISEQNNKAEELKSFEKEVDTNKNFLEIQGYHIKPYNRILEVKLNKSIYYIYSPIYILRQNSQKISDAIYIGILLKLSNKILKKRTTNHMHSILDKKNRDQLLKVLNNYLLLDKVSLRSINRLFTFNTTLFKEQKKMKQGTIEELSICSQEIISKFANNIIDIIDYLPVYKQYQIVKADNSLLNPDGKVSFNGVLIPNFFSLISKSKKNCFVKFKTGEIGFKLDLDGKDIVLKFKIPSIDKGFQIIPVYNMITVNVTKWYSINDINGYGISNEKLANAIVASIKKLYAPINDKHYTLASFFKMVDELKDNYKIKSLYERISNCYPFTKDNYRVYCQEMKYLYNYIKNPHLLKQDNCGSAIATSVAISNALASNYNFKDYKGTNGIFYSLSNEADVINSNVSLRNIQAKFVKKFAYVPCTDKVKSIFSLLVIEIDLSTSKVNIECYGKQRINYAFNIEVSAYTFSFITPPKDNALYYARLISAVCNKIFKKYEHNPSISYCVSSSKTPNKYSHNDEITLIKYTDSKPSTNYIQTKNSYEITSESKGIHFRRGHWHYYWYGHRNSPDRYKKLKWVNETIVNRNADSIIIQL